MQCFLHLFLACPNPTMISTSALSCNSSSVLDGKKVKHSWSSDKFACKNAFDGNAFTRWGTEDGDVGLWIRVQFPQNVWLTTIKYQHGHLYLNREYKFMEGFKNVSLQFSDGTKLTSILPNAHGFIDLHMKYPMLTTSLHLTAESVYPPRKNGTKKSYGIRELQFFGCSGMQLLRH